MVKVQIPSVLNDPDFPGEAHLNLEDGDTIAIDSIAWQHWLEKHSSFRFDSRDNHFTAYKRQRDTGEYWYANRKVSGKTLNLYLGKSEAVSLSRMIQIASKLSESVQPDVQPNWVVQTNVQPAPVVQPNVQLQSGIDSVEDDNARLREQTEKFRALEEDNLQMRSQLDALKEDADKSQKLASDYYCQMQDTLKQADLWREKADERDRLFPAMAREIENLQDENNKLRLQLAGCTHYAAEIESLRLKVAALALEDVHHREQIQELQTRPAVTPEVIEILRGALKLKANAGGAIKKEIEKVLELMVIADSK